jgi:hypothetical protein
MSEVDYKVKYLKYKKKYLELKEQSGGNKIIPVFEHQFPADLKAFAVQRDWVRDYINEDMNSFDWGKRLPVFSHTPVILSNIKIKLSFNAKFLSSFTAGIVAEDNFILEVSFDNSVNKDQKGGKVAIGSNFIDITSHKMEFLDNTQNALTEMGGKSETVYDYIRLFNWAGYKTPILIWQDSAGEHQRIIKSINNSMESQVHLDEFNKLSDDQKNIIKNNMHMIRFNMASDITSNIVVKNPEMNKETKKTPVYIICGLTKDAFGSEDKYKEDISKISVESLHKAAGKGHEIGDDNEHKLVNLIRDVLTTFKNMSTLQDNPKESPGKIDKVGKEKKESIVAKFELLEPVKKKSGRKVIHRK